MQVAFFTYPALPDLSFDGGLLGRGLHARRVTGLPAVWQDASVAWTEFDLILLRSTWDATSTSDRALALPGVRSRNGLAPGRGNYVAVGAMSRSAPRRMGCGRDARLVRP